MSLARRDFLKASGAALASGALVKGCIEDEASDVSGTEPPPREDAAETADPPTTGSVARDEPTREEDLEWSDVRAAFDLSPDKIHMSAMLLASHPQPVRQAIADHRRALDADPVEYLEANNAPLKQAARDAAGAYLGVAPSAIALTDSTTMGLGLVYNGLVLSPDQEILTTDEDYYVTHESLRLSAERAGASLRRVALHDGAAEATADDLVTRLIDQVRPQTRVLAVTWVHSSTGLKLPIGRIAEALAEIDAERDEDDRILLCVDGVHGFGVEDVTMDDLGCDFLIAGCHKWLFGPRGTGIIAGSERGWRATRPTIPSFIDGAPYQAWLKNAEAPSGPTTAARMSPGGFKPFEHQWAMREAFAFQQDIGKSRVADRTHQLARRLKEGLAELGAVTIHTPMDDELSAGIVAFEVDGMSPQQTVRTLRDRQIVASVAPYAVPRVRLTPSICNSTAEIDAVVGEIAALAGA